LPGDLQPTLLADMAVQRRKGGEKREKRGRGAGVRPRGQPLFVLPHVGGGRRKKRGERGENRSADLPGAEPLSDVWLLQEGKKSRVIPSGAWVGIVTRGDQ